MEEPIVVSIPHGGWKVAEEVREILNQHMEKIRRENIEYQTMFKMIKTKLAKEKDIVL